MRLNTEGANPPNENTHFYNNIWSDPTGTMGAENPSRPNDFSDTPPDDTLSFTLSNNLYWNGSEPMPSDSNELINYNDDPHAVVDDPLLPDQAGMVMPRWDPITNQFAGGSTSIRQAFENLVFMYGVLDRKSPAINAAEAKYSSSEDILGNARPSGSDADMGACEYRAWFSMHGILFLLGFE
jgi:hypothetical protein